jgi:hypothetical protein
MLPPRKKPVRIRVLNLQLSLKMQLNIFFTENIFTKFGIFFWLGGIWQMSSISALMQSSKFCGFSVRCCAWAQVRFLYAWILAEKPFS